MKMNSIIKASWTSPPRCVVVGQLVRYHRPRSEEIGVRAAIWNGPGSMQVGSAPDALCPEDGVLLQVLACGVCGTDVRSFYNGDRRIEPPWVLGHEISGEVVEVGPRAEAEVAALGIDVGDLVHCISTLWCGRCRMCRGGAENLCLNGELMGFDHPGAYAERVAIPNIALKNLFRIPDGLSPAHATFADPLSDVICGHKDIAIGLDDVVVVVGAGPVGTAHAALARLQGAGEVLLLERTARRLDLARDILGDERMAYVDTDERDAGAAVMQATEGFGADVVIVACSSDVAQQDAMEMAAPRGRVLFFGGLPKGTTHIAFPSNVLHYREVQVHGSYASRHRDQVRALDMLATDAGGICSVVSDIIGLDETPDAFPRIRAGDALKVVVAP
jgi:L-iditol 2-dehydrogenase